ncbi:forkhead box protein N5-like [Salarias fasciatus]|uniref:forkhead box protein N5-like n=1 Tax=Salarias fasciatus TaxID=181472 RepID=UPI0011767D07|nr:forkhead box protein N5-like [Salarias fasciatus]
MTAPVATRAWLFDLHCSVGLTDWDMGKELKLATTTDQCCHDDKLNNQYVARRPSSKASRRKDEFIWYDKTSDTFVKPNPWLWVNPNIACPVKYRKSAGLQTLGGPAEEVQKNRISKTKHAPKETKNGAPRKPAKTRRRGRTTLDNGTLKSGCWPRPPVNYCILITLALRSSPSGSLKVQQIYNFIREHFPFFQTAPDGWKNTIRHNLCFNSSFHKTCNQVCRDDKRKSCFWHLTLEGQRRLKDDLSTVTGESLRQLERSMSHPGE